MKPHLCGLLPLGDCVITFTEICGDDGYLGRVENLPSETAQNYAGHNGFGIAIDKGCR